MNALCMASSHPADADEQIADLRDLLTHVVNGHTYTSRDDVALVQIPADVFAEIRDRVEHT